MIQDLGDHTRIPVIIGCGQINDRAATGSEGLDSCELMIAAARAAGDDAGGGLIGQVDWLGVVHQLSFPRLTGTLVDGISRVLGITPAHATQTNSPTGDSPILLINQAANAIGRGEANVALIVGAEALRTAARLRAEVADPADPRPKEPYPRRQEQMSAIRISYGLLTPADIYPLYENAARPAYGQTLAEGQTETGVIWSNMSQVALTNPHAWLHRKYSPAEIIQPSAENRPIAHPYTKLMVANAAVNQGAAVIVTSLAAAQAAGIAKERMVYVGTGVAAHEDEDPFCRADFVHSPSAEVSLRQALLLNSLVVNDLDYMELYSCFPCVPKMARRILGLPADAAMTVVGGLTFGGGPIGNYMTHAAASMVMALRKSGTNGLLFANGGYATHNHSIILTRTPQSAGTFPQNFDFQAEADALRPAVPALQPEYEGPSKIETYTVLFDRHGGARHGVVIARTPNGTRSIAKIPAEDTPAIELLCTGSVEGVGMLGCITRTGALNFWRFA